MGIFRHKKFAFVILIVLLFGIFFSGLNFFGSSQNILTYASLDDLNYAFKNKIFGNFYSLSYSKDVFADDENLIKVDVKFLNLITVKSYVVNTSDAEIYAGGNSVGVCLRTKGVVLLGSNSIITENGLVDTLSGSNLGVGDLILKINDEDIFTLDDIVDIINREENAGKEVKITFVRKNKEYETFVLPAKDVETGKFKLGIWVKNDASGVGTLTYVMENGDFGALGHSINVGGTKEAYQINGGKIYSCTIMGVNKGKKGKAGELKGLFLQGKNSEGEIEKNISTGIYGKLNENSSLLEEAKLRKYKIGGRFSARPGKAKILSCIGGNEVKEYDIEIIKTNYQNTSKEKSMVIKVVDSTLLEKTGGIVQGMSGSPIIQNGKIIGAVTHVFINDPTKGFGLYLDWML